MGHGKWINDNTVIDENDRWCQGKLFHTQFYPLRFNYDILLSLEMERTTSRKLDAGL